eukprot:5028298-Prorocentrum_lima.AAC.1
MITIEVFGGAILVDQTKLRANPDYWHDVDIFGLEGCDLVPSQGVLASYEDQRPPTPGPRLGCSPDM